MSDIDDYKGKKRRKSNRKSNRKAKKSVKKRGCTLQTTKKYSTRPSPPYPANECKHYHMFGNDGNRYHSVGNKNGVYTWKRVQKKNKRLLLLLISFVKNLKNFIIQ